MSFISIWAWVIPKLDSKSIIHQAIPEISTGICSLKLIAAIRKDLRLFLFTLIQKPCWRCLTFFGEIAGETVKGYTNGY